MAFRYNYGANDYPEYNSTPSGDSIYGKYGSQTPAAKQNQQNYAAPTSYGGGKSDPYETFRQNSAAWAQGGRAAQPQPAPPKMSTAPSGLASTLAGSAPQPTQPIGSYGGIRPPQMPAPPVPGQTTPASRLGLISPNFRDPEFGAEPIAPSPTPPGQPQPQPPRTGGSLPGDGEIIPFPKDPTVEPPWLGGGGGGGTIGQYPPGTIPQNPRHPYDPGQQGPRGVTRPPPGQTRPGDPMNGIDFLPLPEDQKYNPPQLTPEEWAKQNAAKTPLQYGTGFIQQQKDGVANGTIDPKSLPDELLTAMGYTKEQIGNLRNPPPPGAAPPATPPGGGTTPPPGGGTGQPNILDAMSHLYDPLFKQQQTDLSRVLRAEGALTGMTDSGGYQESFGRGMERLTADQGAQKAGLIQHAQDQAQQLAIAEMQDATQRYGIDTNDKLQRWLNSADSNTIQKYGIDKQAMMQEYIAQLQLRGQQYMAGAQINAEAMRSAIQLEIAKQNNATNLQLGTMNNNLGWGNLQAGMYNNSQNVYMAELGMLLNAGISPALAAQIMAGFGPNNPIFTTHG